MTNHPSSHGRGGAGNINSSSGSPLVVEDLATPHLTTPIVTTGRGGTGNMAKNTDAAETRRRQDVEPVVRPHHDGPIHVGRGGAGNAYKPGPDDDAHIARQTAALEAAMQERDAKRQSGTTAAVGPATSHDAARENASAGAPRRSSSSHGRDKSPGAAGHDTKGLATLGKEWLMGKRS